MQDAYFPAFVKMRKGDTALGTPPGLVGKENTDWELVGQDGIRWGALGFNAYKLLGRIEFS